MAACRGASTRVFPLNETEATLKKRTGGQCEVCGEPATVHMAVIDHGRRTNRHLCARHAHDALPHISAARDNGAVGPLENLKGSDSGRGDGSGPGMGQAVWTRRALTGKGQGEML
jgi:hypothetical protein